MTLKLYQAKAGDGLRNKAMKRADTFFKTPLEAASEALSIKEKMDVKYQNEIQWDYEAAFTGSREKMKILRGYLAGNKKTTPFYLQILSVEASKEVNPVTPLKPNNITSKDQKMLDHVHQLFS